MSILGRPNPGPDLHQALLELDQQGYCVVPDVLDQSEIAAIKGRLMEQASGECARGVSFHDGGPTCPNQRVWMLMNKGRIFRDLMLHPIVGAMMGHLLGPDFLLSSFTANIAHPGGEPMDLHTDQGYLGFWTPVPTVANIIWMLDDFTAENGGTRLVPASHINQNATPQAPGVVSENPTDTPTFADTIAAEGGAGSIICFDGRLWHGTGANRSNQPRHALLGYYCRPYIRQQENFSLGLDPAIRAKERPALLKLLGFVPWAALGKVESPTPEIPLFVSSGAVGPLSTNGATLDSLC